MMWSNLLSVYQYDCSINHAAEVSFVYLDAAETCLSSLLCSKLCLTYKSPLGCMVRMFHSSAEKAHFKKETKEGMKGGCEFWVRLLVVWSWCLYTKLSES